jgi:hypothetical protein
MHYEADQWPQAASSAAAGRPEDADVLGSMGRWLREWATCGRALRLSTLRAKPVDSAAGTWWAGRIAAVLGDTVSALSLLRSVRERVRHDVALHTDIDPLRPSADEQYTEMMRPKG